MEKIILECKEGNLLGDSNYAHNYRILLDDNLYITSLFDPSIFKTQKFEAEKEFIQKIGESIYLLKPIKILQNAEFTCFIFNNSSEWNLFSYVSRKGILSESEALHYLKQIYYGYNCYINLGLSKRDFTLENVILTNTSENNDEINTKITSYHSIKIFDFGFKLHQKENDNLYQPPECFEQNGYISGVSDVWSLGMIFFYMLFGKLPFRTKKTETFLKFIKLFKIQIPNGINKVSNSTENLLKKMLTSDPTKRISWKELIIELEKEEDNDKIIPKFSNKNLLSFYDEDENKEQRLILFSDSENEEQNNDINPSTKMITLLEKIKKNKKKIETDNNKIDSFRNSLKFSVHLLKESSVQNIEQYEKFKKTQKVDNHLPISPDMAHFNEDFQFVSIYEGNQKKFSSSISLKMSRYEEYSSKIIHQLSLFGIFLKTFATGSIELGGKLDLWSFIGFLITKKLICLRIQFKSNQSYYSQFRKEFLESDVYLQLMKGFDVKTNELKKKMEVLMEETKNLLKRFDKEDVSHILPFVNLDYEQDFGKLFYCFLRLYEKQIDGLIKNRESKLKMEKFNFPTQDTFSLKLSKHKAEIYECLVIAETNDLDLVESNRISLSGDEERISQYCERLKEQLMYFSVKHGFTNF